MPLFAAIRSHLDPARVELVELDTDVNDPEFAAAMAARLDRLVQNARTQEAEQHAAHQSL